MAEKIATRHAYGAALLEEGGKNEKIVVLDADVSTCTMSCFFGEKYPERFFNVGIAEANMVGMAAGMATTGLIPFVHTFAMFMAGRCFDQIRNSIGYPGLNVKVVGTHAGLTVGEDGATHQCLEDIGLMRTIPGLTVICPADGNETKHALKAIADYKGPVYFRLSRMEQETVTESEDYCFRIGKSIQLRQGTDLTVIAAGVMVQEALKAANILEKDNVSVRVINMHTVKPLDKAAVIAAAKETGFIVTAEEHNVLTGLGGAVSEVVTEECPCLVLKVGVQDAFGRSGSAQQLMELYKLDAADIVKTAREGLAKIK